MTEERFKKGIEELKNVRMSDAEKSRMLDNIFSSPVPSPYMKKLPVFAFIRSVHVRTILTSCLVLAVSLSGLVYASNASLPGDILYPVKTQVVEPVIGAVKYLPEEQVSWEAEKVDKRIAEAEALAKKDKLDDNKVAELQKSIEKSSTAFVQAVDAVASSTEESAASTSEKKENFKQDFRDKINNRKNDWRDKHQEQINKLKDAALHAVDEDGGDNNSHNRGKGRGGDKEED